MIVSRAPMLLTFLGNSLYTKRAISTTIDKYVYAVVNHTPLVDKISARYSLSEMVNNVDDLKNNRIRNALNILEIKNNVEIGTFASFPLEIGFSSRASYTAALLIALMSYKNGLVQSDKLCNLIDKVEEISGSNISKHTSHAIVHGGMTKYDFNENYLNSSSVLLDFKGKYDLERGISIYYVSTSSQKSIFKKTKNIDKRDSEHLDSLIEIFSKSLEIGDITQAAYWLDKGWQIEKKIGFNIPNKVISSVFDVAFENGALGGKYIGDHSSGCLFFLNQGDKQNMSKAINKYFINNKIDKFNEYSIKLTQSGTNILLDTER